MSDCGPTQDETKLSKVQDSLDLAAYKRAMVDAGALYWQTVWVGTDEREEGDT